MNAADVDTSLTEKEVEAMVDKTAMELMVHQALAKLQAIGQDAVEAHQKAAGAVKAHVEQLKAALAQSQQEGSLKDLSDMVLNSQKVATDCVAAAKAAQVFEIMFVDPCIVFLWIYRFLKKSTHCKKLVCLSSIVVVLSMVQVKIILYSG